MSSALKIITHRQIVRDSYMLFFDSGLNLEHKLCQSADINLPGIMVVLSYMAHYFPQLQVYLNSSRLSNKYIKVKGINEDKTQWLNADVMVFFHGVRTRRLSCKYVGVFWVKITHANIDCLELWIKISHLKKLWFKNLKYFLVEDCLCCQATIMSLFFRILLTPEEA